MSLQCPNPDSAMTLAQIVNRLKTDSEFASDFKQTLASAIENDQTAIDCIDSYLAPTAEELQAKSVSKSEVALYSSCTESGKLALILASP
jgi:hypothetical protein